MQQDLSESRVLWLTQRLSDLPSGDDWLSDSERAHLARFAFPKRARDWKLGRWTAKLAALAALGETEQALPLTSVEVAVSPGGAPFILARGAPVRFALSLSHSGDVGFCTIDPAGNPVGCDIEFVESRSPEFTADYFTPAEVASLSTAPTAERPMWATLVWSAKESALKALGEGLRRDTRSVEVSLQEKEVGRLWRALTVRCLRSCRILRGWWRSDDTFVLTLLGPVCVGLPHALHPPEICRDYTGGPRGSD